MPSFKPKAIKKLPIVNNTASTLDSTHDSKLEEFNKNENEIIPKLKKEKEQLIELFNKTLIIDEKLNIKDKIKKITCQIKTLKQKKKNYYLTNSNIIFNYFENKKKISEGETNTKSLDKFFKINNKKSENNNNEMQKNIQQYMYNNNEIVKIDNYIVSNDICSYCNIGELIPIDYEGRLVCNNCSKSVEYLIEGEKPSYKEPPKEVCFYAYKRINHFREILAQFQAKETTQIPDNVLEDIITQIKKERIDISQITNKKAKEILKKLGHNKYYEHIPFIKDKLGIKPPVMSQELEETLCNLFMEIQGPYAKYCPDDRVNFLNYYYTVYKLCELLNKPEFLPYFPMLKDREKRIEQDEIWKQICKELNWEFIPTI
jgi:hypothetical protein